MNKENPEFRSNIPEPLLQNATPEMQWVMKTMDVLSQKTDYVVDKQNEQSDELKAIKEQTMRTNGRVTKLEGQVHDLEHLKEDTAKVCEDIKDIVKTKRFVSKYMLNKYFAICFIIFIFGAVKAAANPQVREFIIAVLGL